MLDYSKLIHEIKRASYDHALLKKQFSEFANLCAEQIKSNHLGISNISAEYKSDIDALEINFAGRKLQFQFSCIKEDTKLKGLITCLMKAKSSEQDIVIEKFFFDKDGRSNIYCEEENADFLIISDTAAMYLMLHYTYLSLNFESISF